MTTLPSHDCDDEGRRRSAPKHHLVEVSRTLIEAVALIDVVSPAEELERITDVLRDATGWLRRLPSYPSMGSAPPPANVTAERGPFAGRSNPLAPPALIELDGNSAATTVTFRPAYEGPPGAVHGGMVAGVFDTLFGVAQRSSGLVGVTGRLSVTYRRLTPMGVPVEFRAWIASIDGRKIHCRAAATADDQLCAEADCVFIVPRDGRPIDAA